MKKSLVLTAILSLTTAQAMLAADKGNLNIVVTGANNNSGVVRIALYGNENAYKSDKDNTGDGAVARAASMIKDASSDAAFKDLPYGKYAIKVFHDEDNSGKFYTGMFGIPKVQYGFSNNARGTMGPASFDKAMFEFKSPEEKMTITLTK